VRFGGECVQRWQLGIPFDQGRSRTELMKGETVQIPDSIGYRSIVCVDAHRSIAVSVMSVSGEMDLADGIGWQARDVALGIDTLILGIDHEVVEIE